MVKTNEKGFILCPYCEKRTKVKILPTTTVKNFPLFCEWCKKEAIISIP